MNSVPAIHKIVLMLTFVCAAAIVVVAQGPSFKYGVEYVCNKERVVVRYCRNDRGQPVPPSDNYCHVEYLDRPTNVPTIPFFTAELRSDIAVKLNSCTDPATGKSAAMAGAASDTSIAKARNANVDLSNRRNAVRRAIATAGMPAPSIHTLDPELLHGRCRLRESDRERLRN